MNPRRFVMITLASTLLSTSVLGRQSSGLDPSFGTGGRVVTDFFDAADEARGVAIEPDGSILAVGSVFHPGHGRDLAVARYSADGVLALPAAIVDFHPGQGLNDEGVAVATLSDGRVVAGASTMSDRVQNNDFAVVRLLPSLVPDPTFGTDGRAITDFFGGFDLATAMVVQPDGRIIMVGMIANASGEQDFGLVRYNTDGTLDASFGNGGRVVTNNSESEIPSGVALQLDGKIVVVGSTFAGAPELTMIRYLPDGSLDHTFGAGGKVFLNSYTANPNAVAVQSDGRIVVAGVAFPDGQTGDFIVWRFEPDGDLDSTFGAEGRVFTDFGRWDSARAVTIQDDGRIVAAGYTELPPDAESTDFAIARYESNGDLDASFADAGRAVTDFFGRRDSGEAVAIQPGRGIVVGGLVNNPENGTSDFGLARYGGPPNQPPVISGAAANPPVLWPPNHKMIDVTIAYRVEDDTDTTPLCVLTVTSSEAVNGAGDGNTSPDWEVVDAQHVRLRAERSGTRNGRVYTVTVRCSDATGASTERRVRVTVLKSAKN